MRREELENMGTAELVDLRAEIEVLLAERSLAGQPGGGREVIEERSSGRGTLRRELTVDADGSVHGPHWHLYYYQDTKTGKRKLVNENLGRELPEEHRD
jgi:hypothetical protein